MLETFRATLNEIRVLEEQLDKLIKDEHEWRQTDTVKGSSTEYPYLPTVFKVSGFSPEESETVSEIRKKQKQTKKRILDKKLTLEQQRAVTERWLDTIDDPNIRCIIRLYYIEGYSYEKICRFLGTEGDGSTQRKQINKFWKSRK
jgi:DNA-directed RNA polymerase specialized sigma24 family protein